MKLKIFLFSIVFINCYSQKIIGFKNYPISTSTSFLLSDVPDLLIGKTFWYKGALAKMPFKFVSTSEIEEVRGITASKYGGRISYYVDILANSYGNRRLKYLFHLKLSYIDAKEGLILDNISGEGERIF